MDRSVKRIGMINWIALLVANTGIGLISVYVHSLAGVMAAEFTGLGLFVALLSFCQMSLEGREQMEKLEMDELSKSRGAESLFATAGEDTFPAKRSREQFERYFVPVLTVFLFIGQAAGSVLLWRYAATAQPVQPERVPLAAALFGLLFLLLFILGKYSSGLARLQKQRLLRPGGAYLLLSAYSCLVAALTLVAVLCKFAKADFVIGRVLCVVLGLIALETLVGLVFEIYRVRLKGRETRLMYDSRLVGLFGQPEALITTAAHALDYQFGFKVSETWFYRMLEKSLAWLILAQVVILALSTCIAVVQPGEQALLERFGRPLGDGVIGPGLHLKMPWPIDQVYRYRTEQIQSFVVGAEPETSKVIQWKVPHAKEDNFMVANHSTEAVTESNAPPVSLLSVSIPVQFQITNLTQWAYLNQNPTDLLQMLSRREVARYLAGADMENVMSVGRGDAETALLNAIQDQSNQRQLGVRITFVGLQDVHPPQKVAGDYEQIVMESEKREAQILDAETYAIQTNAMAEGLSHQRVAEAQADRANSITNAAARANLFASQARAFAAAPGDDGVYERLTYLDVLKEVTGRGQRRIINATGNNDIIYEYNEEPKIRNLGNSLTIPNK